MIRKTNVKWTQIHSITERCQQSTHTVTNIIAIAVVVYTLFACCCCWWWGWLCIDKPHRSIQSIKTSMNIHECHIRSSQSRVFIWFFFYCSLLFLSLFGYLINSLLHSFTLSIDFYLCFSPSLSRYHTWSVVFQYVISKSISRATGQFARYSLMWYKSQRSTHTHTHENWDQKSYRSNR